MLVENTITLASLYKILFEEEPLTLSDPCMQKLEESFNFLKTFSNDKIIYGINTGFGPMAQYRIEDESLSQLQYNIIRSHATGAGQPLPELYVKAAIDAGVKRVVCLSTDKAAYPINAMGISKAMMERVIYANARVAAERGGTVIACTRYGNVMCSRGSVIPLFIDQIKSGNPITITDPNMTRFLMNLDEAVDLVMFAFQHANPGDLFIQKADASTIGDLAKAVQKLFGDTGTHIIGTRHGEKLYETLMTREERLRSEDMGNYYRVAADNRDLNYDKYVVKGHVHTMADESYTSHNTNRLDVEGTVKKILTTDYVKEALANWEAGK